MMNRNLTTRSNRSREMSPWSGFRDDLWDLFDRFSQDFEMPLTQSQEQFVPKIEVKDKGDSYLVCAEVPGMDEKDINLSLKENSLIIEGEKKKEFKDEDKKKGYFHSEFSYGSFYRAIPLGEDVDTENVSATYRNGVLDVTLKKLPEKVSKNKKIQITSSGGRTDSQRVEQKH